MTRYYAVIDTNVLVSSVLNLNSIPGKVIDLCLKGVIVPLYDNRIVKEYREVLNRPKFCFSKEDVDNIIDSIIKYGVFIKANKSNINLFDPKDIMFLEVLIESKKFYDSYLITGNIKHFPNDDDIIMPRDMIDMIVDSSEEN